MGQQLLAFAPLGPALSPVSPARELGAYEELWLRDGMTFPRMATLFREHPEALPSDLVSAEQATARAEEVLGILRRESVSRFGVRVHRAGEYPQKLRDARNPVELLYFQGWWNLVETRCIAVVGTRHPSAEGAQKAKQIAKLLVRDGFTVVSGLAAGIDTAAHEGALEAGGMTIAVIGTPLGVAYPATNALLQQQLSREHLVISQVPVLRYDRQGIQQNRLFFPERNVTMSALTEATIIVEAGETSGTLIQARAALQQGRKLLILDECFRNSQVSWPAKHVERGAVRVHSFEEMRAALAQ
jgi:DNA processing protein